MILKSLHIKDCLSFGDSSLEVRPLNMLIGANGAGKSNFIRVLEVLQLLSHGRRPDAGSEFFRYSGDSQAAIGVVQATFEVTATQEICYTVYLEHRDSFGTLGFIGAREVFDGCGLSEDEAKRRVRTFFHSSKIYRPYSGIFSILRSKKQCADFQKYGVLGKELENFLEVLKRLFALPDVKAQILAVLRIVQDDIEDVFVRTVGDVNHLSWRIKGVTRDIPYFCMSEGVLRVLMHLVVLLNPEKPLFVCFDMPERGLHFDVLPSLAELFVQASGQDMQLVVSTHSDVLLDALHDRAESVVVVERGHSGTSLNRLDAEKLKPLLEKYRLGDLWSRGDLGALRF